MYAVAYVEVGAARPMILVLIATQLIFYSMAHEPAPKS